MNSLLQGRPGEPPAATYLHALGRWLVRPLVRTSVQPNQITTVRLLTGLIAAVLFGIGSAECTFWGGVFYLVSSVLDRADGELARIANRKSFFGHKYDLASDAICHVAAFIGIGVGLRDGPAGVWSIALGVSAGLGLGMIFTVIALIEHLTKSTAPVLPGKFGIDPDDGLILISPIAWLGATALWWLTAAASIGAPLFAVWLVWSERKILFYHPPTPPADGSTHPS